MWKPLSSAYTSIYIDQGIWSNSCIHAHLVFILTFLFSFLVRVIPNALVPLEVWTSTSLSISFVWMWLLIMTCSQISGHAVGEVLIVSDMHERKAEMARRADAFVALPGMQIFVN